VNESLPKDARWLGISVAIAIFICLLSASGSAKAAVHEEHFCWGAKATGSQPCLGLSEGSVHRWVSGIGVSGVEHSVCVTHFLGPKEKACTSGPGAGAFLDLGSVEYSDYGWIYPNSGAGETTVYGTIYWEDPPVWYSDNLGGSMSADPDISSWGPGRLDVFALGSDGKTLKHKWLSGGAWSGWENRTTGYASGPGAVSWDENRIDVVGALSNGTVAHEYWTNNVWAKDNLGGNIIYEPDIASWGWGRLDVFGLAPDGTLKHKWFTAAEGWSGWESRTCCYTSTPGAVAWGNGRLDVVSRASDGSVAHEYWDGTWHKDNLGGYTVSAPDIASWGPGRLDVFMRGADGTTYYHKWFSAQEGWSGWETRLSGYGSGPGVVSWGQNRLDVVGRRASDGSIKHEYWQR
jgi:hypothetical protein